eukprot:TRINITY_DN17104_c0_g1_i6.p3 TRINITY_DN17104_c0_g1~~TRINITY_DN17104_c0_g1_i6.p3  ORF type:complete len:105 (+),score=6.95 TRINITY_DN17104_c0_g1_i6:818-1132(+)
MLGLVCLVTGANMRQRWCRISGSYLASRRRLLQDVLPHGTCDEMHMGLLAVGGRPFCQHVHHTPPGCNRCLKWEYCKSDRRPDELAGTAAAASANGSRKFKSGV